ncbi:MAG: signal peptide peptidase SppA [Acidobacteria bacterium]|nr:signal peptide peptidase SppA [Acidobacteriota bacterium]MBK8809659.1 signal peptide peptidase SppA [Acidobacteriota bacterium]
MSNTKKVVLILGGLTVIAVLLCVIIFAVLFESMGRPSVPQNSVLVLKVSGDLPDYAPEDPTARLLGINQPQSFSSLLTQLRKAKVDNRIGGIVLDINFPGIGWGKADELRDAIKDFRASGKPAYAYMQIGTNKEYYIATAAEKIFVAPAGDLYVNGFAASVSFYRGSLDKLGIEPQFLKIGKYKNAPDQYTEKSMTEPHREVINAILDEYYGRMTKAIADERKKSVEDVKALIDNAPYHADDALQVGLIDGASYRDQVYDELKTRLGYKTEEALRTIPANEYREISSDSLGLNKGEKIAIVYASGAINIGSSNNGPFGGETMGSDTIVKAVNTAANDPSIKAIVLRVDSPGGSSLASDLMWHALENAKAKKPVVVSMADVAASGGYYISCNANKIVAQPSTVTGSIGVFMGKPVMKGFYDWLGISNEYVMRGKNSGIFRETEKWSGTELEKMQKQVEKIYFNDFVPKVAKGRGKTNEEVNTIAQGRVWTGTQAKQVGLIDEFGGLEKAIEIAKELANLPADRDVKRISFPEPRPFFDTMFGSSEENTMTQEQQAATALVKSLPEEMRRSFRYAAMLDQMRNGEAMLLLPYELEVK